jgi:hypothetical protein
MADAPADQITDFEALTVRHIGGHEFRVLNRAAETVSEVDLEAMTCSCEDMTYNRNRDREVCKHVQTAMFQAPEVRISVQDTAPFYLSEAVDRAQTAAETVETVVDSLDKGLTGVRDEQAQQAAESPLVDDSADPDPVATLEAVTMWVEEGYASPDLVDVRSGTHGDRPGTILEPDSQAMDEADKETFKSLVKTLEDSDCHAGFLDDGCSQCGADDGEYWWFVPEDDSSEVWT